MLLSKSDDIVEENLDRDIIEDSYFVNNVSNPWNEQLVKARKSRMSSEKDIASGSFFKNNLKD